MASPSSTSSNSAPRNLRSPSTLPARGLNYLNEWKKNLTLKKTPFWKFKEIRRALTFTTNNNNSNNTDNNSENFGQHRRHPEVTSISPEPNIHVKVHAKSKVNDNVSLNEHTMHDTTSREPNGRPESDRGQKKLNSPHPLELGSRSRSKSRPTSELRPGSRKESDRRIMEWLDLKREQFLKRRRRSRRHSTPDSVFMDISPTPSALGSTGNGDTESYNQGQRSPGFQFTTIHSRQGHETSDLSSLSFTGSDDDEVQYPKVASKASDLRSRVAKDELFWTNFIQEIDQEIEKEGHDDNVKVSNQGISAKIKSKLTGQGKVKAIPVRPVNPFYHRIKYNLYDCIKVALLTVTLFPLRLILVLLTMTMALLLSRIAMLGLTFEKSQENPLARWRTFMKRFVVIPTIRLAFFWGGFHWVSIKGQRASPRVAPIYVVASHSSIFDCLYALFLGAPSIVSRADVRNIPILGKLLDCAQGIYVRRDTAQSRQTSLKQIQERADRSLNIPTHDKVTQPFPQTLIFPEGTCTNRTCLASFKLGAFRPGFPIQPVIVNYPNRMDTLTWTFDGSSSSGLRSLWLTLCQFHVYVQMELLPVYFPSPEEINYPDVFAQNVQKYMAEAMSIPATDFGYSDGVDLVHMRKSGVVSNMQRFQQNRKKLGLDSFNLRSFKKEVEFILQKAKDGQKMDLNMNSSSDDKEKWNLTLEEFTRYLSSLDAKSKNNILQDDLILSMEVGVDLFKLYGRTQGEKDKRSDKDKVVDIREYFLHALFLQSSEILDLEKIEEIIFNLYKDVEIDPDFKSEKMEPGISKESFQLLMTSRIFGLTEEEAIGLLDKNKTNDRETESNNNLHVFTKKEFHQIVKKRVNYAKLFAMEVLGQL